VRKAAQALHKQHGGRDSHSLLARNGGCGGLGVGKHGCQRCGVEVALVEHALALTGNGGHDASPGSVAQMLPAKSVLTATGSSANSPYSQERALSHVGVHASRCAPYSSPVSACSAFYFATMRSGENVPVAMVNPSHKIGCSRLPSPSYQ
jgi:hypothetical protein